MKEIIVSAETTPCPWCKGVVSADTLRCPHCKMTIKEASAEPVKALPPLKKGRKSIERIEPFSDVLEGIPIMGIDPGAKYTGVVVRDGDVILYSITLLRPQDMKPLPWALDAAHQIVEIKKEFPLALVAIEGITDPKGFNQGKRAPINPGSIMRTAAVAGACYALFPDAMIIPPGNNGNQHESNYPLSLRGRRPKDLPGKNTGAGTRGHEQSAFDVAGKGAIIARLDNDNEIKL